MKCQNCGKKLKTNEHFCTNCGYYIEDENSHELKEENLNLLDESIYETKEEYDYVKEFNLKADSSGTKETEFFYEEEKYLEAYIGEDYKLIKKSPFNIYAFLLNWMYILYRKMYIFGIIGMILTYLIIILNPKFLIIYILIIMLVIGLIFNKTYIFFSKLKVENFLKKHQDIDNFTLENLLRKKGGVKVSIALIIYLIFLIILFFSLFTFHYIKNTDKFLKQNSENEATCTSLTKIAYKNLNNNEQKENISEGICKINLKNNKKEYEIILRIKNSNSTYLIDYKTENDFLVFIIDTKKQQELEIKNINNNLTLQEKDELEKYKQIEENYVQIKNNAIKENEQIKNKKNTTEKKNYVFSKKEIIR